MRSRTYLGESDEGTPRFRDLFRIRAFAVLYGAETLSIAGDQLARIALSVLVFQRTNSATATALTYAATFLPAILGGALLARIGDRLPRRAVMVGCDLVRAALFALMAVPAMPLPVVVGLLVVSVFIGPAFSAAEVSYLAAALDDDQFRAATGLRMVTNQIAQVGGFAIGGVLVAALLPRGALLVDAGTFAVSAVVIGLALRVALSTSRPADTPGDAAGEEFPGLLRHRRLRALIALSTLSGFFIVPEGLAVPFANHVGASTVQAGLLLASIPLGGALGTVFLVRFVRRRARAAVSGWMAIGCGLPLAVTAFDPPWPIAWVCWFVSGALAAFQVEVVTSVVRSIPDRLRSRLVGFASSWLIGAQGLGLLLFGAIAGSAGVGRSIGLAGLVGAALAVLLVAGPLRSSAEFHPAHRSHDTPEHRESSEKRSDSKKGADYAARHKNCVPAGSVCDCPPGPVASVESGPADDAGSGVDAGAASGRRR